MKQSNCWISRSLLLLAIAFSSPKPNHGFSCRSSLPQMPPATRRRNVMVFGSAGDDFNQIEIDDVMSEVEMALKEADNALTTGASTSSSSSSSPSSPSFASDSKSVDSTMSSPSVEQYTEILSAFTGGTVMGTVAGAVLDFGIPNINTLVDPAIPPAVLAITFAILGVVGVSAGGEARKTTNLLLVAPTQAVAMSLINLVKSILEALGLAAKRKVEQTTSEIKAIPGKVADSAKAKARETADDIKNIPNRVGNAAKQKAMETIDDARASVGRTLEDIVSTPQRTLQQIQAGNTDLIVPLLIASTVVGLGCYALFTSITSG